MLIQDKQTYDKWFGILYQQLVSCALRKRTFCDAASYAYQLNTVLVQNGFPAVGNTEYYPMWEVLKNAVNDFMQAAPDHKRAAGALLWKCLKTDCPGQVNNQSYGKADFAAEKSFKKNMVELLGCLDLDVSTKDKLKLLNFLGYKYECPQYARMYDHLGKFSLSENAVEFNANRRDTIELLHKFMPKFKSGKKVTLARRFLESVALQADLLEDVKITTMYGDEKSLDLKSRSQIYKYAQASGIPFSEESLNYFAGKNKEEVGAESYLGIVLHKLAKTGDAEAKKVVLDASFARVHLLLQKQEKVSDSLVLKYTDFLFGYAAYHHDDNTVSPVMLEKLLVTNAKNKNELVSKSCLAEDWVSPKELIDIDKSLVLRIAKKYADSFAFETNPNRKINPDFHSEMTDMFRKTVSFKDYTKHETRQLTEALSKNESPEMKKMTRAVTNAHTRTMVYKNANVRSL